ncbi:glutathione S-transferase family protein [Pararhizobium mangrovi]|uniref:Glutathione S-transferase family protein n=2 Tax=Pararhizobium mangrovi TaxID=2590452 RepID=A0A506U4Y0_9HYPH|nr:glutathione S-transferase family protein [Pararhizobium mangrovi]
MITVYGRATSSNVQAVMWAIAELGLDHERLDYGGRHGGTDTPEFLAMNPNGLVPVVRDGDHVPMFEAGAIMRTLATAYGSAPFWPAEPYERAPVDMWAEWAKTTACAAFTGPIFWAVVRTPKEKQDPGAIARAVERFDRVLAIAEDRLSKNRYLAGDDFTMADIQFGHILYRYFDIDITRPSRPALEAYYERLTERPAYRDHVMVSYDELKA